MERRGIRSKRNVERDETILELPSTGKTPERTEDLPSGANELESIKDASSQDLKLQAPPSPGERGSNSTRAQKRSNLFRLPIRKYVKERVKRFGESTRDGISEKKSAMMVARALIATLTYQAALNPPGSFWQEDKNGTAGSNLAPAPLGYRTSDQNDVHEPGTAINSSLNVFSVFLTFNAVGLFASLVIILILTSAINIRRQFMMWVLMIIMWVSVFSVGFSFLSGVGMILPDMLDYDESFDRLIILGLGCMGLLAILVILHTLIGLKEIFLWLKKKLPCCGKKDYAASHSLSHRTA